MLGDLTWCLNRFGQPLFCVNQIYCVEENTLRNLTSRIPVWFFTVQISTSLDPEIHFTNKTSSAVQQFNTMPASNSMKNKPIRPPFTATNSWVIRHAREIIGYDEYDEIAREIEEGRASEKIEDDLVQSLASLKTGSNSLLEISDHHLPDTPKDYDPECEGGNGQKSIVENLEAAAAEMEANHLGDELAVAGPEQEPEGECSRYLARGDSGSNMLSNPTNPSNSNLNSTNYCNSNLNSHSRSGSGFEALTVPRPAYKTRHSRANHQENASVQNEYASPYAYTANNSDTPKYHTAYTAAQALAHGNEIERGASPMPRVRVTSASPPLHLQPAVNTVPSTVSISIPDSIYSRTPTRSRSLRFSKKIEPRPRGSRDRCSDTKMSNPQRTARLTVPRYTRHHFSTSPFVDMGECITPESIIEEQEEEGEEAEGRGGECERRGRFR
ncbi:hypothetical protein F5Y03DRAFT_261013 [Xylaria venustula]|nr:hypothetical protein F5Y03DRAFT_261013 [Xylaria venustula]